MKKIKIVKFNKIAALAIIVSVSGSGTPAYARAASNNKLPNSNTSYSEHYKNSMDIIGKLDDLVTSGSINQKQKAAVIKYLVTYKQPLADSNIDKLSSTGTVSKKDETIIYKLFTSYKNSISNAIVYKFSARLSILVDLDTITEFQKKEIMNLYPIYNINSEDLIDINVLVTSKTITKNQQIAVLNSFAYCRDSTWKAINDILLSKLDKLINEGTINGEQRTAVINLARIPNADTQKLELHRRLDTLVAVGTITNDNETDVINALL